MVVFERESSGTCSQSSHARHQTTYLLRCLHSSVLLKIIQRSPSFAAMWILDTLWYYILKQQISRFFSLLSRWGIEQTSIIHGISLWEWLSMGEDSPQPLREMFVWKRPLVILMPTLACQHTQAYTHAHLRNTIQKEDAFLWGSPAPSPLVKGTSSITEHH